MNQMTRNFDRFFFSPEGTRALGLFRILISTILLVDAFWLIGDFGFWLGPSGLLGEPGFLNQPGMNEFGLLKFLPQQDLWIEIFLAVYVVSLLGLLTGVAIRWSAAIAFICLFSIHHRNPLLIGHGGLSLLRNDLFLMIFTPSQQEFSLRQKGGLRLKAKPWAQRVMQVQLSIVYLTTALWKLHSPEWRDGTAVYYVSRIHWLVRPWAQSFFNSMALVRVETWGTLVVELLLGTLIWNRKWRYPVLIIGILFHLTLEMTLNIPLFQWIMISNLLLFLNEKDLSFGGVK
jgi:hypothetical protein